MESIENETIQSYQQVSLDQQARCLRGLNLWQEDVSGTQKITSLSTKKAGKSQLDTSKVGGQRPPAPDQDNPSTKIQPKEGLTPPPSPPPHSPPPEPVLPPPTQAQIQRQQIRLQQQQQIRQMELLQEEEQLQQQQTPNQIKSKAAGLEELYDFVEKHSTYYQGAIPSRDYLSDAGRADLVKVVRRLGGARAAAAALTNYKAEVLDTRVTPSSPRTTPTVAKPDSEVSSQVAETSMAHEYLREGTLPALQKRARRPYSARLRAAERRVPPEPVWARMGKQQANMSRDAFAREVESALSRDLCLMIEHHTTGRETDGFWTLWRTPLKAPTAEVSDVLDAAEACARHYPTHFIRAAAFDNAKGGAQTIALTYHVPTDTVEPNQ